MRVLSGRLKAVLVATLATIVLVGVIGPATTLASNPPGLARFMYAMGQVESGGNYYARNPYSGAYGKYQIMPSNWPSWARRYLGNANAKQTPANQEIVAAGKFRSLYRGLDSWRRVAYWWLTGLEPDHRLVDLRDPLRQQGHVPSTAAPPRPAPRPPSASSIHRYSEGSPKITYSGTWRTAGHRAYAGDEAEVLDRGGRDRVVRVQRQEGHLVWPGRPDPRQGQDPDRRRPT